MTTWGAALALVGVAVTALGGYWTARAGNRTAPYTALAERTVQLEQQRAADLAMIEEIRDQMSAMRRRLDLVVDDRDALVTYIDSIRRWIASGATPPAPPVPARLRDVLPEWEWPTQPRNIL